MVYRYVAIYGNWYVAIYSCMYEITCDGSADVSIPGNVYFVMLLCTLDFVTSSSV